MEDIFKQLGSYFQPKMYPIPDQLTDKELPIETYRLICQIEVLTNVVRYFISMKPDYQNDDILNRCIIHVKTRIVELKNELKKYEFYKELI